MNSKSQPCAPECMKQSIPRADPNAIQSEGSRHEVSGCQIFHHIASFLKPKVRSPATGIVSFTKGKRRILYFHPKSKQVELVRARSPTKGATFARSYEFLRFCYDFFQAEGASWLDLGHIKAVTSQSRLRVRSVFLRENEVFCVFASDWQPFVA